MYDKKYVQSWIKNYESGKDIFRKKNLEPYLKKTISKLPVNTKILDVGCGWGTVAKFLKKTHIYSGVDIAVDFFDYIRKKFKHPNLTLKYGALPNKINFPDNSFNVVICSLTLHVVSDLKKSIKTLFSKVKQGGKVIIIDFPDESVQEIKDCMFDPIYKENERYIKGEAILRSGTKILTEVYLHKEKDREKEILKYGSFLKKKLGGPFIVYECVKIKK